MRTAQLLFIQKTIKNTKISKKNFLSNFSSKVHFSKNGNVEYLWYVKCFCVGIWYWILVETSGLVLEKNYFFDFALKKWPLFMKKTFSRGKCAQNLLIKNIVLWFRKYHSTFLHANLLPVLTCTFKWIFHSWLHRGGPPREKLHFWN